MLKLSEQVNQVSTNIRRRARTMRGKKVAPAEFRIIPAEKGKAVRIVRFHRDADTDEVFIECYSESDHAGCEANDHARMCSHAQKAITMLLQGQRKQRA